MGLGTASDVGHAAVPEAVVTARLFEVCVGIPAAVTGGPPVFWRDPVEAAEFPVPRPGIDVLTGLGLLLASRRTLDGPAGTFALEF